MGAARLAHGQARDLSVGTAGRPDAADTMAQVLPELVSYLEGLPEPHILFDRQYRILAANAAYRRQFAPQGSVVGRTCYEVSHRYAAAVATGRFSRAAEGNPRYIGNSVIKGKKYRRGLIPLSLRR